MRILTIDIGGTNIKYAFATRDGQLSNKASLPTEADLGADNLFEKICRIIDETSSKETLDGIAISTAGQVNAENGSIVHATDAIPNYTGFSLREKIEGRYGITTSVENDVHCAALGERWKGRASAKDFIALTLGTGIGGAIVIDGKIYHGKNYSAGEIGHMTLIHNGYECTCGHKGCLEQYASAQALDRMIEVEFGKLTTGDFFEMVRSNHETATEIFLEWVNYLTDGLKGLVHLFNPSLIMIGGGITVQGKFLEESIEENLASKIMESYKDGLHIRLMRLGNDANLLGALYWFLESKEKNENNGL